MLERKLSCTILYESCNYVKTAYYLQRTILKYWKSKFKNAILAIDFVIIISSVHYQIVKNT